MLLEGAGRLQFRWLWLLALGLGAQLLFGLTSTPASVLLLSMGLVAVFLFANRSLPGFRLTLIGLALNIAVIGANGHMPVSTGAIRSARLADVPRLDLRHGIADTSSTLSFLGDVIPAGERAFSAGDILMVMGLLVFIGVSSRRALIAGPNRRRPRLI